MEENNDMLSWCLGMGKKLSRFLLELRRRNRHFLTGYDGVIEKIKCFVKDVTQYHLVKCDEKLFRARVLTPIDCDNLVLEKSGVINGVVNRMYVDPCAHGISGNFVGFDERDCGAPPASICVEGRACGKGIRRLYVAEEMETAVAEVRPSLRSVVNVAEMQVTYDDFWVLDLTNMEEHDKYSMPREFIDRQFATPCLGIGDSEGYCFTQWLTDLVESVRAETAQEILDYRGGAERIKEVRGIRYSSAMNNDGHNLVIFPLQKSMTSINNEDEESSEECFGIKPIKSELYYPDMVKYETKPLRVVLENGGIPVCECGSDTVSKSV
jgi:hypothetical protein